jgi:hypothetical protein
LSSLTIVPTAEGVVPQLRNNGFKGVRSIAAALVSCVLLGQSVAQAAGDVKWITGPELVKQRLAQPVNILWSSTPLRSALGSLARAQQVAILLDRRVDPGQKIDLTLKDAPLEAVLATIADRLGLGVARLGSVVYLGPPSTAKRLASAAATLQQATRRLPPAMRQKLLQSKPMAWDDLATPRELLAQLTEQNGLELVGLDQVPHDLWAAADLPPLALVDRLTLIAAQFDLDFQIATGGTRLELVPVSFDSRRLPAETRKATSTTKHQTKSSTTESAAHVDRIRVERMSIQAKPLGPVLRQLADRLGLELRIDEEALQAAGISLDQRISATIEDASVDDVLRELLKSTGLQFHRRQQVVEIFPAK